MEKSKRKRCIPKEPEERVLIYGVHPSDKRNPKKVYCFWASIYLIEQFPCVGDMVRVKAKRKYSDGKEKIRKTILYVTDVQRWEEGMYEPNSIANFLLEGKKYKEFQYETE